MTRPGDPLARLAIDLGKVAERVAVVEQTVTEAVGELTDKVAELATAVQTSASPQQPGVRVDARPWAELVKLGYGEGTPFDDLCGWIESVLVPQYGEYLALPVTAAGTLPRCWPKHPAACNELWTLYLLWDHAFLNTETGPREAGDWHDRWLPSALERLVKVFKSCLHDETSRAAELSYQHAAAPTG